MYIKNLHLTNYRNFTDFQLTVSNNCILLLGPNGAGKTNVLEAISLNFPGKGVRNAKLDEICKENEHYWSSASLIETAVGGALIGNHFDKTTNKRIITFNDKKIPNYELNKLSSILWLTPQMDGIFLGSATDRRKFFDRIVYSFDREHASRINKYEHLLHQRSISLQIEPNDNNLISIIENQIVDYAFEIASSRLKVEKILKEAMNNFDSDFPKAILSIEGDVENANLNRNDCINFIQIKLRDNRAKDKLSKRTHFGVHRSDLIVKHDKNHTAAKFCSTGEQKALLIAIMLAQVNAYKQMYNTYPILLLDEIGVHLDSIRREYLVDFILNSGLQIWVTTNDISGIEKLSKYAEVIKLG